MKFKNLNLSTKLTLGFGIVSVLLLALGARVIFVLTHLEENKAEVINSTELADNIMEGKFALRSEQLLIIDSMRWGINLKLMLVL